MNIHTTHAAVLLLILFLGVGWGMSALAALDDWIQSKPITRWRQRRAIRRQRRPWGPR